VQVFEVILGRQTRKSNRPADLDPDFNLVAEASLQFGTG
jgi:hypothetical protein